MIEVVQPGLLTTVQDLGRPGHAHLGVPRSGALDQPALRSANRLVGNPDGAAGLETTLTGCTLRFDQPALAAVTGAHTAVTLDDTAVPSGRPVPVPAGARLRIGPIHAGVRAYLAVAGGIAVPAVLGSRSTDTLSGLGPAPLRRGDRLPVGATSSTLDSLGADAVAAAAGSWSTVMLRIRFGPRADWFTAPAHAALVGAAYSLTAKSNRIGARLAGPGLARAVAGELPSEGVVLGAVQVPADGQPLVFLADHPTTGGYPVIAVVDGADLPLLAQARPGTPVRFRAV